jgi:hypothetical protein
VDITKEVEEEAEEHQLFFRTTGLTGMTIAYNDKDGNNRPIGLNNTVTTPTAGSGYAYRDPAARAQQDGNRRRGR